MAAALRGADARHSPIANVPRCEGAPKRALVPSLPHGSSLAAPPKEESVNLRGALAANRLPELSTSAHRR
jgi:hypothetical protein